MKFSFNKKSSALTHEEHLYGSLVALGKLCARYSKKIDPDNQLKAGTKLFELVCTEALRDAASGAPVFTTQNGGNTLGDTLIRLNYFTRKHDKASFHNYLAQHKGTASGEADNLRTLVVHHDLIAVAVEKHMHHAPASFVTKTLEKLGLFK